MTTSTAKRRALCVATRCATIDQFVETFHRFCGDDETFFVATMTSRPVGLETAFSIQLVDKQPVLRGLCVVLDAWNNPDNRYKRPGIRLGIKRLTTESQIVFDRLKAAARGPVLAEASPPPGPRPQPQAASGSGATARTAAPALPPLVAPSAAAPAAKLPSVIARPGEARGAKSSPPATAPRKRAEDTKPMPVEAKAAVIRESARPEEPRPASAGPKLPPLVARQTGGIVQTPITPGTPNPVLLAEAKQPADDTVRTLAAPPPPATAALPAGEPIAPSAVPSAPAPAGVTRFQVALHVDTIPPPIGEIEFQPRQPMAHRPGEPGGDPAAGQGERAGELRSTVRSSARVEAVAPAAGDASGGTRTERRGRASEPPPDLRTPGSSLVLPANPLHDLSDRSLEGFVDCTLYEEEEDVFHPGLDVGLWLDRTSDAPATFTGRQTSDRIVQAPSRVEPPAIAVAGPATEGGALPPALPGYSGDLQTRSTSYPAAQLIALPTPPSRRELAPWLRWGLIAGPALVAIVLACVVTRLVRGPGRPAAATAGSALPRAAVPAAPEPPPPPVAAARLAEPASEPAAGSAAPAALGGSAASEPAVIGSGPCRLGITTQPPASLVRVDDETIGPAPLVIAASCDRHKLDVSHARYQSVTRTVVLAADQPQQLEISLPRPMHSVTVTSFPPGAELAIDGRRAGTTPTVVEVVGFATVSLTLSKPGFPTVTRKLYSKQAQDRVFVRLAP